ARRGRPDPAGPRRTSLGRTGGPRERLRDRGHLLAQRSHACDIHPSGCLSTVMTPPTITPLLVAELLVEGERWPVYVHVIDHPDARVLVDTGMTELHPEVADLDPRLVPLSEQAFDLA